jgi:drug/metabolite transporter (DMT)-like permease
MPARLVALTLLICALWASVGVAIKFCLQFAPPLGIAAVRMLIAAIAVGVWMNMRPRCRVDWTHWRPMIIATIFFCLLLTFTHLGFHCTSAARGIVLLNTTPLFVALFASFLEPREPMHFAKASGLALAFAGVVTIFFDRLDHNSVSLLGDGLMVLAAISWSIHTLWTKRAAKGVDPAMLTLVQFAGAAVALSLISLATESRMLWRPTNELIAGILYLALLGTVASWLLWVHVLKRVATSAASAFIFSVPVFGVALSWLLLREPIHRPFIAGACLISLGIMIVTAQVRSTKQSDTSLSVEDPGYFLTHRAGHSRPS